MRALLEATDKYSHIEVIENVKADDLKTRIREAIDKSQSPTELFFYYTGHGYQNEDEFFYCATNFDAKRPNETGISTTELHMLLRLAESDLVVKVIDACNSGSLLVKSELITPQNKQGFKNLIQISSCLDSQNSLTGNPLSLFTEKFRLSVLRKMEGVVYYTDAINALRDEFINNNSQTPFFVSQVTGREEFVDDARRFDKIRDSLIPVNEVDSGLVDEQSSVPALTSLQILEAREACMVNPEKMNAFVGDFFDALKSKISINEFADYFSIEFTEHGGFYEDTTRNFIIRVLSQEKRYDNFVTANYSKKYKHRNSLNFMLFPDDDDFVETYDLLLNCSMSRVQFRLIITPKFSPLQRIKLVVSCAPSMDTCYVFGFFVRFNGNARQQLRQPVIAMLSFPQ
ncbi:hypothetical protein BIU88_01230 [Chlorobaculum limnaeum]|uniref:Peptidase C14 caspase domain-containing protein n=2 Tax=Chlorobaculum limnaeum TaxID=274537 RepID=A0A1D8CXQ9_CHLLM|nr:hypothetical protein BIU88_01230 [Chlorobaculum limnaeum]